MMCVQSLTPEACFHIHLTKGESFFKSEFNVLILTSISQLFWKPIVVQCATNTSVKWKLEASSAQILRMDFQ